MISSSTAYSIFFIVGVTPRKRQKSATIKYKGYMERTRKSPRKAKNAIVERDQPRRSPWEVKMRWLGSELVAGDARQVSNLRRD